jgi:hypothetical protein
MIALLMFLLGAYVGVAAFATYAQVITEDEPWWAALGLALQWPWVVAQEFRAARAYRHHPTGDL